MPTLVELTVADSPDAWREAGFTVDDDGQCVVGHVRVWLRPDPERKGVVGWALDDAAEVDEIDGLATTVPAQDPPTPWAHPNRSTLIDHVVVASPDIERTRGALEAAGFDARRVRDTESYGSAMQQVFFRAGEVIVELVGPPEPDEARRDRPAGFFGLAMTVDDLDATKAQLGDGLGDPKDAVQPGRRIATLRGRDLGVTTAIAFMSEGEPSS
jgi:Glyoxalase-like domain